jgi:hypothetical protein
MTQASCKCFLLPQRVDEICVQGDAELQSDGTKFDAIHIGAAAETLPEAVCDLLAPNGRMMVPVGEHGRAQVHLSPLLQLACAMSGSLATFACGIWCTLLESYIR